MLLIQLKVFASWGELFPFEESEVLYQNVHVISGHLSLAFQDLVVQGIKPVSLTRFYSSSGALERTKEDFDRLKLVRHSWWLIQEGWSLYPQADLFIQFNQFQEKHSKAEVLLPEPSGAMVHYKTVAREGKWTLHLAPVPETMGSFLGNGEISARMHPKNNRLVVDIKRGKATLYLPNGGMRFYEGPCLSIERGFSWDFPFYFYRLVREVSPDQLRTLFRYDKEHRLEEVLTTNPRETRVFSSIRFELPPYKEGFPPLQFKAKTSDGRAIEYSSLQHEGRDYLFHVQANYFPSQRFDFIPSRKKKGLRLGTFVTAGLEKLKVSYYKPSSMEEERKAEKHPRHILFHWDKVASLLGPEGEKIAQFSYEEGKTEVRDGKGHRRVYAYDPKTNLLQRIEFYDEQNKMHSVEKFFWKGGFLTCKAMCDAKENPLFAKAFSYDSLGNVLEEAFCGELTSKPTSPLQIDPPMEYPEGSKSRRPGRFLPSSPEGRVVGGERYAKRYQYLPGFNVPTREEEDNGLVRTFRYKGGTNLLEACFTCFGDQILSRKFFRYDEDNLLAEEVEDDGNSWNPNAPHRTYRVKKVFVRNSKNGLPEEVVELYGEVGREKLLQKHKFTYSPAHLVLSEEVFDGTGKSRYILRFEYDRAGKLLKKTNALGQATCFTYDVEGKLVSLQEPTSPLAKTFSYDLFSRLISSSDAKSQTKTFYDVDGHVTKTVDLFGNETSFVLDAFGRPMRTLFPQIAEGKPVLHSAYDLQGNLISVTDSLGAVTQTSYNAYRKPLCVTHPDGSKTFFSYDLSGNLVRTKFPDGTEELLTFDALQRQTSKRVRSSQGDILSTEFWEYEGLSLRSYTDPRGLKTYYEYDGAGRKIAQKTGNRRIVFSYDALGNLSEIFDEGTGKKEVRCFDVGGRLVEEYALSPEGVREEHAYYEYDAYNQKSKVTRKTQAGDAVDVFAYDVRGRLISHTDPYGQTTRKVYDEQFCNALGQRVLQKKTVDPEGKMTLETRDALGHVVLLEKRDTEGKTISLEKFSYDALGHLKEVERAVYAQGCLVRQVRNTFAYDARGNKISSCEAGKRVNTFAYDAKGRLISRTKPDGEILSYSYDGLDRLLELKSSDGSVHYHYLYDRGPDPTEVRDLVHRTALSRTYDLQGHILRDGHLFSAYDDAGRRVRLTLPDGSSVGYGYDALHMRTVTRRSPRGDPLYVHRYDAFDIAGHVQEESLIESQGVLKTERDLLERPTLQTSPWLSSSVHFDPLGYVSEIDGTLFGKNSFSYDALHQLTSEKDHTYAFDSLGNPFGESFEVDELNQLCKFSQTSLLFDLNGNPVQKVQRNLTTHYSYDALDRLIEVAEEGRTTRYTYDGLSRLASRSVHTAQGVEVVEFLQDLQGEIGTIDAQGRVKELKVLGLGIRGDLGAAIAIELEGETFVPLHDLKGNLVALASPRERRVVEQYDLSAFGEETTSFSRNPWRFCSKRHEGELISFGLRFYDPRLHRWLTPDPAGPTDHANLYAFLENTPLNRLDLFGLMSRPFNEEDPFQSSMMAPVVPVPAFCLDLPKREPHPALYLGQAVSADLMICAGKAIEMTFSPERPHPFLEHLQGIYHGAREPLSQVKDHHPIIMLSLFVNGIGVSQKEFVQYNEVLARDFQEICPHIGLYDKTHGFEMDMEKISLEKQGHVTIGMRCFQQMLLMTMDFLSDLYPNFLIALSGHSNGAQVIYDTLINLPENTRANAWEHLLIRTYGGIQLIPRKFGVDVQNMISEEDYAAKHYIDRDCTNPQYPVAFVPCLSSSSQCVLKFIDHSFMSPTYRVNSRDNNLKFGKDYDYIYKHIR